jgi:hypothetical protein
MTQPAENYGVTAQGFVAKPVQELISEETADLLATINSQLDVSPVSPLGQVIQIIAEKLAEVWELAQVAYNATNRGAAEGALLDNIGALIGVPRDPATYSGVYASCLFSQAGTYAAGSLVGFIAGQSSQTASNTYPVVVPSVNPLNGLPVSTSNPYVTGSTYATATLFQAPLVGPNFANALIAANAGLFGNVGQFTGQNPVSGWMGSTSLGTASVTQGSVSITLGTAQSLQQGQALTFDTTGNVYFVAANTTASTSANLTTPYGGTTNATATVTQLGLCDLSAPTIGTFVELDTPYRVRQVEELGALGACTLAAISADILEALSNAPSPVIAPAVQVYENTTDFIDNSGLFPHSFEVVVFDGINPNIAQNNPLIGAAILANKPAGIRSYGTTAVTVPDSQGVQRTVSFTRATQVQLYFVFNVTVTSFSIQSQVQQLITTAVEDASQGDAYLAYNATVTPPTNAPTTLAPGVDVIPQAFGGIAQAQAGVVQVLSVLVGTSPNPTSGAVIKMTRETVGHITSIVVNTSTFVP